MQAKRKYICPSCGWAVTHTTTYLRSGRKARTCTCSGEVVNGLGKYAGCLARFMPPVEQIPRNLADGDQFASYPTGTGQTDLVESLPFSEHASVKPARTHAGYRVEVVATGDANEIRVRQAVRNFGFLARRRDIEYAASVGMDLGEFVTGIVEPEADTLCIEGAGLPIISAPPRATRPLGLANMRTWRKATGRVGGISERVKVKGC